jgi:hypothetical protein
MNDGEMKNLDLVEALMKRASGNETKEEGDKLDQLLISGEISHEVMEKANNEVEAMRALLPLIDEDKEAEFPEYARERLQTKVKETFGKVEKTKSSKLSFLKFLVPIAGVGVLVLALLPVSQPSINYQFATIDLIGTVRGGNEALDNKFFPDDVIAERFDDLDKLDEWVKNWPENANEINVKVMYDQIDNIITINFKVNALIIERKFTVKDSFEDVFVKIKDIVEKEITSRK